MPSFTHPTYLFGLATAVTPIVIYLLLRRRKTEVPWGAGYLLRKTLESKRKTSMWKQYLVLAMRCTLLALIALLICRPFRPNPTPSFSAPQLPDEPVHRVILVDHSLSMSVTSGAVSRISRMKSALGALLSTQRAGDRTTLVSLVKPGTPLHPEPLVGALSPVEVERTLDAIRPHEGSIQLRPALGGGMASLAETPETTAEIYVLSDFPREVVADRSRLEWFRQAAEARRVRVACANMVEASEGRHGNVALLEATLGTDLVVARVPVTLYVKAANYSDSEVTATISVSGDEVATQEKAVTLQPDQAKRVALDAIFKKPGVECLRVAVRPSRLRAASETHVSVDVKERLTVWLLADAPDPTREDALGEAEFIRRALGPVGAEEPPMELVEVDLVRLARPIPEEVDVVLIAGPRVITPAVQEPLTRFVRRGGGLVVAMSPSVDPSFYNPNLEGLLPVTLAEPARSDVSPDSFQGARTQATRLPALFTEFSDGRGGHLSAARFFNYMRVEKVSAPEEVWFHLEDREPLLVHKQVGRGHVLLLTSSLGVSWSSLPVRRAFLPLLVRLTSSAAKARMFPRNVRVGEPFVSAWPGVEEVTLTDPDLAENRLETIESSGRTFLVAEEVTRRGKYQLEGRTSGHKESFTAIGVAPEADLRTLEGDQRKELESTLGAIVYPDWPSAVKALGPADESVRLWPWLLLAVLALYMVETWFVRLL